jgi:hypothetical protein
VGGAKGGWLKAKETKQELFVETNFTSDTPLDDHPSPLPYAPTLNTTTF